MSDFAATPWLVCFKPSPAAHAKLFCFPFAGAGAAVFRPWAIRLWPDIEVWGVRLPARESRLRDAPLTRFADAIPALTEIIAPRLSANDTFFGHSLGGLLAFETARHLARQARGPRTLIVAGARAPTLPRSEPDISALNDDAFVAELESRYSGIPKAVRDDPALLAFFLPVLRADIALFESYRFDAGHAPRLACPLHALGGNDDPRVARAQLEPWHEQTSGAFSTRQFPGGHFFIQDSAEPVIAEVARLTLSV